MITYAYLKEERTDRRRQAWGKHGYRLKIVSMKYILFMLKNYLEKNKIHSGSGQKVNWKFNFIKLKLN